MHKHSYKLLVGANYHRVHVFECRQCWHRRFIGKDVMAFMTMDHTGDITATNAIILSSMVVLGWTRPRGV